MAGGGFCVSLNKTKYYPSRGWRAACRSRPGCRRTRSASRSWTRRSRTCPCPLTLPGPFGSPSRTRSASPLSRPGPRGTCPSAPPSPGPRTSARPLRGSCSGWGCGWFRRAARRAVCRRRGWRFRGSRAFRRMDSRGLWPWRWGSSLLRACRAGACRWPASPSASR